MIIDYSLQCHSEPFGFVQDKLREESPGQLSQEAQLPGDSHLHLRQVQVSLPSVVQNDMKAFV